MKNAIENKKELKRIAVTGGAGQIAYSLLFRLAAGELFGLKQQVALHILETAEAMKSLEGVKMELEDCAFPLLKEIHIGSNPREAFDGVDCAFLIGAKPRGPGMERADLLADNGKIFVEQGKALNETASKNVKVLVVGNPCNTNCLIAMQHAPKIPRQNFFAMTRLDQNRAVALLAKKTNQEISKIENLVIWGNHSSTQVPDFTQALIDKKPATQTISDLAWFQNEFITTVQKRGAAIIEARGKSSAASAANAAIDTIKSLLEPTPKGQWYSCGIYSRGNSYGIDENLIFSFPCYTTEKGECRMVEGLNWNDFIKGKIILSENELKEERELVHFLIA